MLLRCSGSGSLICLSGHTAICEKRHILKSFNPLSHELVIVLFCYSFTSSNWIAYFRRADYKKPGQLRQHLIEIISESFQFLLPCVSLICFREEYAHKGRPALIYYDVPPFFCQSSLWELLNYLTPFLFRLCHDLLLFLKLLYSLSLFRNHLF